MVKRIIRKCVSCGKKISINILNKKGHYDKGHYFGKMKIPVGKGEYKKIKTDKLFNKKVDVVEWTGRKKEVEYWECNDCYEEAMHECWLEETIEKLFGNRCKKFNKDCACCQAWNIHDTIIDDNRGKL